MFRCWPILVCVVLVGCSPKNSSSPTETDSSSIDTTPENSGPQATDEASQDPESSDLRGRVTLDGTAPGPRKIQINKNADICGAAETVIDVTVGDTGGVEGVIIEIMGVEQTDAAFEKPEDGYNMRQKGCVFTPHVLVVPHGQDVAIHNDDPVGHNVNTGDWNLQQPSGADPIVKPVDAKTPVRVVCNIHSWMEGWLYPVQSTFYAVTDKNGEYSIHGVPPGKYRVSIWHPFLGPQRERVALEAGKVFQLDHSYEAP